MGHLEGHEGANRRMLAINHRVKDEDVFSVGAHEDSQRDTAASSTTRLRGGARCPQSHTLRPRTSPPPPSPCTSAWCCMTRNTYAGRYALRHDAVALVTIGPGLTRDAYMQAIGRLRQLDGAQRFGLVVPEVISEKINETSTGTKDWSCAQRLVAWLLLNTDYAVQSNVVNWVEQAVYFRITDAERRRDELDNGDTIETDDANSLEKTSQTLPAEEKIETSVWYIDDQDQPDALYGKHCRPETPATRALALLTKHAEHFIDDTPGSELHAGMETIAKSLQPHSDPGAANTDHGFNKLVQREMQQQ
ncbi:hypothetical protein SARC_12352 [Sphaeroforma arctica JP610]|uniref:Uncharacterized protein n=1 Tax=Sphaeroforma arctica JP610 TaxID=667725 RepID=A0A0L0FF86_9EUKA|nr:hypothetical protein SARC_12352 [Sphaeroforma arctica JP610]KNC75116.1 hypothetical protein SARC_12352 [Sphaeroforma arctica JP610]|eukprot:XP_014149018.1 hypothetical protein SARC_12352 [Sphaeroforma arctica JP610]